MTPRQWVILAPDVSRPPCRQLGNQLPCGVTSYTLMLYMFICLFKDAASSLDCTISFIASNCRARIEGSGPAPVPDSTAARPGRTDTVP